jgi:hypothetical protein
MTKTVIPSQQELAWRELEWRKIKKSFAYFIDTYGRMWVKEGGDPIAFKLWPFQRDAAEILQSQKKVIVLKARQMGMSWLCSAYCLWRCITRSNFHAYYTSIGLKEVQEQMERVRFIFHGLPDWIQYRAVLGGKECKDNDQLIEFTNGSAIHATASGKSAGHGSSPGLIICDEWARVEEAVKKWRALKPSAGKNTQIFLVSTSDGFANHFAEMWFEAKNGSSGFTPIFYSWRDHPEYTETFIAEQKRDFAGDLQGFLEAYPESPEDAFLSSSRSVFDLQRIGDWKDEIRRLENSGEICMKIGALEENRSHGFDFEEDPSEHLMVWKTPISGHRYGMGVDVAEGLVKGDYSAFAVLDVETDEVVALYRAKISTEFYAPIIESCARWYNMAWLAVEVNMNSDLIIGDLKQTYPFLYMRPQRARITDIPTLVPGFYTSGTSKTRIIAQMRRYFSDEEHPLKIYSDIILDEMSQFEQDDRKRLSGSQGHHDDTVMAVAIAIEAKQTLPYQIEGENYRRERHQDWRSL